MMIPSNIATVCYLNTIPFVYGLKCAKNTLHTELLLDIPANCTSNFVNGKADIALIPSADLKNLTDYKIVTSFCIGAVGAVRTVVLAANIPLNQLQTIYLDPHSHTSVELIQILARERWDISVKFAPLTSFSQVGSDPTAGYLLIGDKVFEYESKFSNVIDLASEWIAHTSLPFVFAVWVARPWVSDLELEQLEKALAWGTSHISEAINSTHHKENFSRNFSYLTNNINFSLTSEKRDALRTFLQKVPPSSPI